MRTKFDEVQPATVEIDFRSRTLKATASYVSTRTGTTYGAVTLQAWSPDTYEKLEAFRAAMARDFLALVQDQGPALGPSPVAPDQRTPIGLDEYLQERK